MVKPLHRTILNAKFTKILVQCAFHNLVVPSSMIDIFCPSATQVDKRLGHKRSPLKTDRATARNQAQGEGRALSAQLYTFNEELCRSAYRSHGGLLEEHGSTMTTVLFDLENELYDRVSDFSALEDHLLEVRRVFPFPDISLLPSVSTAADEFNHSVSSFDDILHANVLRSEKNFKTPPKRYTKLHMIFSVRTRSDAGKETSADMLFISYKCDSEQFHSIISKFCLFFSMLAELLVILTPRSGIRILYLLHSFCQHTGSSAGNKTIFLSQH